MVLRLTVLALVLAQSVAGVAAGQTDCLGDCDGSGAVRVNELTLGVSVALGLAPLSRCPAFDDGSGTVSISVLLRAVRLALDGCQFDLPDLVPESAYPHRPPVGRPCIVSLSEIPPPVTSICIANQGATSGPFDVLVVDRVAQDRYRIAGIEGGEKECFDRPYLDAPLEITADVGDEIEEFDELNNVDTFHIRLPRVAIPLSTRPPFCTPTPTATPTPTSTATVTPALSAGFLDAAQEE